MEQVNVGDKVLVPRTGGGVTPGEVIEVYPLYRTARVTFPVSGTFQGEPTEERDRPGYKTVKWADLEPVVPEEEPDFIFKTVTIEHVVVDLEPVEEGGNEDATTEGKEPGGS